MSDGNDLRGWGKQLGALSHVGIMFPVAIAFGVGIGYWLDNRLGTGPWLLLLGFAFGVATALRELLRSVDKLDDE